MPNQEPPERENTPPLTFDDVRAIALSFPGVEEGTAYGTPAFRVNGKFLCRLREADVLAIKVDEIARDILLQSDPETFYITEHFRNYPGYVLVRLSRVEREELRRLFEDAWRREAPRRLLAAYDGKP